MFETIIARNIVPFTKARLLPILLCTLFCSTILPQSLHAEDKAKAKSGKAKVETKKKATPAKKHKITFTEHILPVFRQHCGSCHNANDKKGGLILDDYTAMMEGGGSGDVIETGDPDSSYLMMTITRETEPFMPPNQDKIPAKDIKLIKDWIKLGAPRNSGSKVVKKENKVGKVTVSLSRPKGPPVLPETISLEPTRFSKRPNSISAMAASPWAPLVAFSGYRQVFLYDTKVGEIAGVLPFEEGTPQVLKFSRNGRLLLAGGGRGGASGKVVLWDVKSGKRIATVGHEYDQVLAADLSPDQTKVVLAGPKKMVRVYDVKSGELLYEKKKHTNWITSAAFSPDGVLLATGDRNGGFFLWEAATGREYLPLAGHKGSITSVAWLPDSNKVASSSEDGTIKLWELNDGNVVKSWNAHRSGVTHMSIASDGRIVSTGRDKITRVWDTSGKRLLNLPTLKNIGTKTCLDAERGVVVTGDWAGQVHLWDHKTAKLVAVVASNPISIKARLFQVQQKISISTAIEKQAQGRISAVHKKVSNRKLAATSAGKKYNAALAELKNIKTTRTATSHEINAKSKLESETNKLLDQAKRNVSQFEKQEKIRIASLEKQQSKIKKKDKAALNKLLATKKSSGDVAKKKRAKLQAGVTALQAKRTAAQKAKQAVQKKMAGLNQKLNQQNKAVPQLNAAWKKLQKAMPRTSGENKLLASLSKQAQVAKLSVDKDKQREAYMTKHRNALQQSASTKK